MTGVQTCALPIYGLLVSQIINALYAFIIWLTMPFMSFNLRTSYQYVLLGCISVGLVMFAHQYLPFLYSDPITVMVSTQMSDIEFLKNMAFYEVGITEEVSKLLTFILICRVRRLTDSNDDSRNDSPIATMVYCAMVSLGFAIIENAHYASNYGSDINQQHRAEMHTLTFFSQHMTGHRELCMMTVC